MEEYSKYLDDLAQRNTLAFDKMSLEEDKEEKKPSKTTSPSIEEFDINIAKLKRD